VFYKDAKQKINRFGRVLIVMQVQNVGAWLAWEKRRQTLSQRLVAEPERRY
jgi:hypothetical protein